MLKKSAKTLILFALIPALCQTASAAPLSPGEAACLDTKPARLAQSPIPPGQQSGAMLLQIRDMRQAGGAGGCWSHCFNRYDECMGIKGKEVCVPQMKTCMETCDRLSGISNPTQRQ
jgi:hypothetical protein